MDKREPNKLSIIIPVYNEGQNITQVIENTSKILKQIGNAGLFEIIVVDDGSTDNTGLIADEVSKHLNDIKVIRHHKNMGFGAALKTGFANAGGEYVTIIPGDGEVTMEQSLKLFKLMKNADLIVSMRKGKRPVHRRVFAWGWHILIRFILGFNPYGMDGIFVIRCDILRKVKLISNSGTLHFEILMRCMANRYEIKRGIIEINPRLGGTSKVTNLPTIARTLLDMIKIRLDLIKESLF